VSQARSAITAAGDAFRDLPHVTGTLGTPPTAFAGRPDPRQFAVDFTSTPVATVAHHETRTSSIVASRQHTVLSPNGCDEFFQRSFDTLATQPARNRFDEPPKQRGKASAEPESFHLDVHAGFVFGQLRETAGAPQISAVASGRKKVLVGLARVPDSRI
jgi:hypothetical protein